MRTISARIDASLGRVLAHELGHQLLPGCQHSKTGIMSAKVDLRSPTVPRFTAEQGASIRTLLTASMQAQASSASCSAN
jgi:hypothetical protein